MKKLMSFLISCSFFLFACNGTVFPPPENPEEKSPSEQDDSNKGTSDPKEEKEKPEFFTLFSFNDLHGSLEPYVDTGSYEVGAARLKYAIENDVDYDKDTSIILSAGDSYQGGYLSYKDKKMVSEVLNEMNVDAMAIGNHEFDWGISTMKEMLSYLDFPVLGANVLESGKRPDYLDGSTIINTESGLSIGVVGVIGSSERSSIKQTIVSNYEFSGAISYIEDELDKMKDCDFRILLAHDSISSTYLQNVASELNSDKYEIDGIVGGHTHKFEAEKQDGIPFIQAGSNSKGYGKMKFKVATGECVSFQYCTFDESDYEVEDSFLDQKILSLIKNSSDIYHPKEEIGLSLDQEFNRYNQMYRLIPSAMMAKAKKLGVKKDNPLLVIHNTGGIRDSLPAGALTRERVGKCCPFDNKLQYIRDISGSKFYSLCSNNVSNYYSKGNYYCYMTEDGSVPDNNTVYDVISIDYCTESSYFSKAKFPLYTYWETFQENGNDVIMTDVIVDYFVDLASSGTTVLKASDYSIK